MDYNNAMSFLDTLELRGICPGLDNMRVLCAELGNPQDKLRTVHISGTNGKGSVGAYIESILQTSGNTVCRFVSPAVGERIEKFMVNGLTVDKNDFARAVGRVKTAVEAVSERGIYPTVFEAETAIAFELFSELSPQYTIIECGMGGLFDCTNVIASPVAVVIMPISLDHCAFLGDTIGDIARHKSGIIKSGAPVICAAQPDDAMYEIYKSAQKADVCVYRSDEVSDERYFSDHTEFVLDGTSYTTGMLGTYQPKNAAVAIKTAELLGIDSADIVKGIGMASWQYRFERIGKFILDGAHNAAAADELARSLKYTTKGSTAFVCGCFSDKDYKTIVKTTAPFASEVFTVTPPTKRGLDSKILAHEFEMNSVTAHSCELYEAIKRANEKYDNIIVFGSLSILSEAKRIIRELEKDGTS